MSETTMMQVEDATAAAAAQQNPQAPTDADPNGASSSSYDIAKVRQMITACQQGHLHIIQTLIEERDGLYAKQQDPETGTSPLMAAALAGNGALCQYLLERGAPWNAVDRQLKCAGNHATEQGHWAVVNLLVDWGVRAELILGTLERRILTESTSTATTQTSSTAGSSTSQQGRPVEHEPCTKPDYLQQPLTYTDNGQALLDADKDAVMMEWERPLMQAHAQILMEPIANVVVNVTGQSPQEQQQQQPKRKNVLNVGFGMGIIDSILQQHYGDSGQIEKHYIIEAHPDVYRRMKQQGWHEKPNVVVLFGKWQDVVPNVLLAQGIQMDAIFWDTYGEHAMDLQDFHGYLPQLLQKPHGIYSFFNGLAPDNLFFHGVACQVVKLQLSQLGLDSEFLQCEIQDNSASNNNNNNPLVTEQDWQGVRRPYWRDNNNTYYLPRVVWNAQFLQTGVAAFDHPVLLEQQQRAREREDATMNDDTGKRLRM